MIFIFPYIYDDLHFPKNMMIFNSLYMWWPSLFHTYELYFPVHIMIFTFHISAVIGHQMSSVVTMVTDDISLLDAMRCARRGLLSHAPVHTYTTHTGRLSTRASPDKSHPITRPAIVCDGHFLRGGGGRVHACLLMLVCAVMHCIAQTWFTNNYDHWYYLIISYLNSSRLFNNKKILGIRRKYHYGNYIAI